MLCKGCGGCMHLHTYVLTRAGYSSTELLRILCVIQNNVQVLMIYTYIYMYSTYIHKPTYILSPAYILLPACCNVLQNVQLQAGRTVFSKWTPGCFQSLLHWCLSPKEERNTPSGVHCAQSVLQGFCAHGLSTS